MERATIYVFESDDYAQNLPHAVAWVRCMHCGSKYVVVVPLPLDGEPFECPVCREVTRFNRQRRPRSKKGVDRAQE